MDNRQDRRRNQKAQKANYRQLIRVARKKRKKGQRRESELAFQEAAVADNTEAEPHHIMALMAYEDGRLEDAGNHIIEASMRANNNPIIHADCGAIMNMLGRSAEAEAACRHVIDLDPKHIEAYNNLSVALTQQNRHTEALEVCDLALERRPDYVDALINKANILVSLDDPVAAIEIYTIVIGKAPENPLARVNLGSALRMVGELQSAEEQYKIGLDLRPDYPEAHVGIGLVLTVRGDYEGAQAAFCEALTLRPNFGAAQLNLAATKFKAGELEGAEEEYRRIFRTHPNAAPAQTGLGVVLLAKGELNKARSAFRAAVDLDPSEGEAWMNLASAPGVDISVSDREKILELIDDKRLKLEQRIAMLFALGEIADKKGKYAEAFRHFESANKAREMAMQKLDKAYDPNSMDKFAETIITKFSKAGSYLEDGNNSQQPVFIVGMPRSGTTLVAQIIGSHPEVESRGEAKTFHSSLNDFPHSFKNYSSKALAEKALKSLSSPLPRVVDKTPFHFMHIGLIRRILPKSSIIFCLRDSEDLGLSCYFQNFVTDYPWATSLENIGRFIAFHNRLLSHWRSLYSDTIHELSYEALIANPEKESRRLIEYIGLPWDGACLNFYKNKNTVYTASNWQVRQPIYATSVKRARFYKSHLTPLRKALGRK